MLKSIFLGGCLGISLLSTPVAVYAQAQQLMTPPPAQAAVSEEISPLELQQFVQVLKQWRVIEMEMQKKMTQAIKAEGLTPERFLEIERKQDNFSLSSGAAVSEQEQQQFEKAQANVRKIWQETQPKKKRVITAQGLDIQRFSQIGQKVEQDRNLQQRVQQMLGN
jgi:hypothetical protein